MSRCLEPLHKRSTWGIRRAIWAQKWKMASSFMEPGTIIRLGLERIGTVGRALGDSAGRPVGTLGTIGGLILVLAGVVGSAPWPGHVAIRPDLGGAQGGIGTMRLGPLPGDKELPPARRVMYFVRREGLAW